MRPVEFKTVSRFISMRNAARLVKNPIPVVRETMAKMGPTYFFHMGGRTKGLITQDLNIVQHILQKNHKNYQKSSLQTHDLAAYVGRGLLTNNGADWLQQRRLIQPAFSRKNINALAEIMEDESRVVLKREIKGGGQINIAHLSAMLTFHIISRAIFSDEVQQHEIIKMRYNIERVQQMLILQVRQPFKKWYYKLTGQIKKHHHLANEAKDLIRNLILARKKSNNRKEDMLQFMLDTRYEDTGAPMHLDQLVDEILILMVAGHETTAQSLIWTIALLNQHPDTLYDIRREISEHGSDYLSYFRDDSILMATIKESMRLYPPAWVLDRVGLRDDVIDNCRIPRDTIIMLFVYGLHHHPTHWQDPETFDPRRFVDNPRPPAYFPFGAGPRQCIGNHFALLELVVSLFQLLTHYDLQSTKIDFPDMKPLITLQPANEVWMEINPL